MGDIKTDIPTNNAFTGATVKQSNDVDRDDAALDVEREKIQEHKAKGKSHEDAIRHASLDMIFGGK